MTDFDNAPLRLAASEGCFHRPAAAAKWRSAGRALRLLRQAARKRECGWALAGSVDGDLLRAAVVVVERWIDAAAAGCSDLAQFVAHTRFHEELEESLVAVTHLINAKKRAGARSGRTPCYDLCCGKGFTGMLVAHTAPMVPALAQTVSDVVLVDWEAKGEIKKGHIAAGSWSRLPMRYRRANLHDARVAADIADGAATRGALVGVHLCKRLSSRLAEMFLRLRGVDAMVLAPCCLPHAGTVHLGESTLHVPQLRTLDDPYSGWCGWLESSIRGAGAEVESHTPPLRARLGKHRKNCFIVAARRVEAAPQRMRDPNPEQVCLGYWFCGRCRFGTRCRLPHVAGDWC
eukprot:TRINITY_DN7099_c0_g1_i1.p1 TRINITY_DN7099_c0_g1~~TRINITY_DN7099_c0_g1_i1.p1  ORF type:complete len:373 (+),score=123.01 TRINITY_DN7099_c0_g1_i1:84-1121(+)